MPDCDATLLRRFAETRAESAFTDFVHRHLDAVYSAALRRVAGDIHLAEDVTQQAFVALARCATTVARHPAPSAWLHLATRNLAANAVRAERRRKAREQEIFAMREVFAEPGAPVDWGCIAPVIDAEIDRLNDRDRAAVVLRFLENRTFADIGVALRVSEDAARMRVDRALEKLRAALARRGIGSTSAALSVVLANHVVAAAPAGLAANCVTGAVAGAATTSATSVGVLQLMTSAKLTLGIAGIALLITGLGTAAHEVTRAHAAASALSADREFNRVLSDRLRATEEQISSTERETAQLSKHLRDAAAAEATRNAAAKIANAASRNSTAEGQAFMKRHPAVREALIAWIDAQTNFTWSAFYEDAGLSENQIAEFQLLFREGNWIEFNGEPHVRLSISTGMSFEEIESRRRRLLGPDGYQKYQAFSRTIPARNLGAQLASALAFTPTPLTSSQFDQFTQTIAENGSTKMSSTGPQFDWNAIATSTTTILAPEQRNALNALRAQADFDGEFSRVRSAALASSKPTSGGMSPR